MEIIITLLAIIGTIVGLVLYSSFSWGYVSYIIYNWFITPVFTNAPNLSWIQLAGIMFLANCFVHNTSHYYIKDEMKDNDSGLLNSILSPWALLLTAWVFKSIIY